MRAAVRHADARQSQGAQGTGREPPKLAHVRQPRTELTNPAWGSRLNRNVAARTSET
jgi:hypothetical protein